MTDGSGTKDDPWQLRTAPGSSTYEMYRLPDADPPVLRCQVGTTWLSYRLEAVEDLHAWLVAQGDWVDLGAADEKKVPAAGTVEAWGRDESNPVGGLVRAAQRLPRTVRDVPPAVARGTWLGRADPRTAEQPGARPLNVLRLPGVHAGARRSARETPGGRDGEAGQEAETGQRHG